MELSKHFIILDQIHFLGLEWNFNHKYLCFKDVLDSLQAKLGLKAMSHFSLVVEHVKRLKRNKLTLLNPRDTLAKVRNSTSSLSAGPPWFMRWDSRLRSVLSSVGRFGLSHPTSVNPVSVIGTIRALGSWCTRCTCDQWLLTALNWSSPWAKTSNLYSCQPWWKI